MDVRRPLFVAAAAAAAAVVTAAAAAARGADFAGVYRGEVNGKPLVIDLSATRDGGYGGAIRPDHDRYPCTARPDGARLAGTFRAGGHGYDFTATLAGDTITLVTAGRTFTATRGPEVATDRPASVPLAVPPSPQPPPPVAPPVAPPSPPNPLDDGPATNPPSPTPAAGGLGGLFQRAGLGSPVPVTPPATRPALVPAVSPPPVTPTTTPATGPAGNPLAE